MNSSRKLIHDKEHTVLLKKLEDAKQRHKLHPDKVTGIYLEIAEYMRNSLSLVDEAENNYHKVISWGGNFEMCALDCSLAYRNLAEIAIDKDNLKIAIEKINLSVEFAYKARNPGIIQQSLHQRAHIYLSCEQPEKALEFAEKCRNYLFEHSADIDDLKKDGDCKERLAHLQNLIAAIYMELHNMDHFQQYDYDKKALEVNEKSIRYAMEKSNWTLCYRGLIVKLALTIGCERVQIAEAMCNAASKIVPKNSDERRFKRECKCHVALEKMRFCEQGNVSLRKNCALWKCYEEMQKEPDDYSSDLHEDVKNGLFFVYKTEQREKKANTMNVKDNSKRRNAQMVVFEKIGDDATKLGMNEISLHFYQKMLKCADLVEDQRKAWCSMAEAAKDCRLWERALAFYKQVLKIEEQLDYTADQLLETEIEIAIVSAEIGHLSVNDRIQTFRRVFSNCKKIVHKRSILPAYVRFLKAHLNSLSKEEFEDRLKQKIAIENKSICTEIEEIEQEILEETTEDDEFDAMTSGHILAAIRKQMKSLDQQEKIIKEKSNKNKHGESGLHEVARSNDYQSLKELIGKGYDVNQLDHGGWTPLSEAVSARNLANVRLLLMSGANPNTRSTEFLVDSDQNKITSSGLSPLMEACSFGNVDIAKILLQSKARTSTKDDDEWTALEYLWEYLLNAKGMDREGNERTQNFAETLKQKQMEEGFMPRTYNEFLELLDLKQSASHRNPKRNSSESTSREERRINIPNNLSSSSPDRPIFSRKLHDRSVTIDESSDEENNWRKDTDEDVEENKESEDEETRNLVDYRKCISGLRNRHSGSEDASNRKPLLVNRKRSGNIGGRAGPSAKKLFFK